MHIIYIKLVSTNASEGLPFHLLLRETEISFVHLEQQNEKKRSLFI